MSICDKCLHGDVCGLEDNHEEGIVSCADMIPKDLLDKIRDEIKQKNMGSSNNICIKAYNDAIEDALKIIDEYKVTEHYRKLREYYDGKNI